jgi:hypothetical protein
MADKGTIVAAAVFTACPVAWSRSAGLMTLAGAVDEAAVVPDAEVLEPADALDVDVAEAVAPALDVAPPEPVEPAEPVEAGEADPPLAAAVLELVPVDPAPVAAAARAGT